MPATQAAPLQQPLGHDVLLQTQVPPWHSWPETQVPPLVPQTHLPPTQALALLVLQALPQPLQCKKLVWVLRQP